MNKGADWRRLKALVLDSVSSPITKRVYNLGLDEFFAWYGQEPRPGFSKATVAAWRVALEGRGLGHTLPPAGLRTGLETCLVADHPGQSIGRVTRKPLIERDFLVIARIKLVY